MESKKVAHMNGNGDFAKTRKTVRKSSSKTSETSYSFYESQNHTNIKLVKLRHNRKLPANSYLRNAFNSSNKTPVVGSESPPHLEEPLRNRFPGLTDSQWDRVIKSHMYHESLGDWWNVLPKTDYLYSPSSPWYGSEVAPGIPRMPNMSRRSFRRLDLGLNNHVTESSDQISMMANVTGELRVENISWVTKVVRTVRKTFTTTVLTVLDTVTRTVRTIGPNSSSAATSSITRRNYWNALLFMIFFSFLLAALFYGVEPSLSDFAILSVPAVRETFSSVNSTLSHVFSELSSPYFVIWDFLGNSASVLVESICHLPILFAELITIFLGVFQNTLEFKSVPPAVHDSSPLLRNHEVRISKLEEQRAETNQRLDALESAIAWYEKMSQNDLMKKLDQLVSEKLKDSEENQAGKLMLIFNRLNSLEQAAVNATAGGQVQLPLDFRSLVVELVTELLETYHADRTGKPDYAMSSFGGVVVSIRCTRPYVHKTEEFSLWSFTPWDGGSKPDIILKPGVMPGECWAFEGANGNVAVLLPLRIFVTGFTLEHTPKALSPYGRIDSAPRVFSVWGLESLEDRTEYFLGRFTFLDNNKSIQTYDAEVVDKAFNLIELRIESNHGNLEYTCLYRFRVHGIPAE